MSGSRLGSLSAAARPSRDIRARSARKPSSPNRSSSPARWSRVSGRFRDPARLLRGMREKSGQALGPCPGTGTTLPLWTGTGHPALLYSPSYCVIMKLELVGHKLSWEPEYVKYEGHLEKSGGTTAGRGLRAQTLYRRKGQRPWGGHDTPKLPVKPGPHCGPGTECCLSPEQVPLSSNCP